MKSILVALLVFIGIVVHFRNGQTIKFPNCNYIDAVSPEATQILGGADVKGEPYIEIFRSTRTWENCPVAVIPMSQILYIEKVEGL